MAAPAIRSSSTDTYGGGSTIVLTKPSGLALDDIMLAIMYGEDDLSTVATPPSGWTLIERLEVNGSGDYIQYSFWKRAVSGDVSATNFSFTWSPSVFTAGAMIAISGCETSGNPYDTFSSGFTSGFGAPPNVSLTTSGADRLLIYATCNYAVDPSTPPTGFTEQLDVGSPAISYKVQAAAGGTGNIASASGLATASSFLVAFKPPSGGGGATASGNLLLLGCG